MVDPLRVAGNLMQRVRNPEQVASGMETLVVAHLASRLMMLNKRVPVA